MDHVLELIYREALELCRPERLLSERITPDDSPVDVVCIGKCASALMEGALTVFAVRRAFIAAPDGYVPDGWNNRAERATGSHPDLDGASFAAGRRLVDFVTGADLPIVVLISGGASACVERALAPWFSQEDLIDANRWLVRSGLPIASINTVRKHLSAIKGGRLGAVLPPGSRTLIYSDVDPLRPLDVGSGPTVADDSTNEDAAAILDSAPTPIRALAGRLRDSGVPETPKTLPHPWDVIADNRALIEAAAEAARESGFRVRVLAEQQSQDVAPVAAMLVQEATTLERGEILVAGGEPTVRVTGAGHGGRCSELAVRVALLVATNAAPPVDALFGSSDGVDGTSGAAAAIILADKLRKPGIDTSALAEAIAKSDTFHVIPTIGRAIPGNPTANNLRDIYILARG
ncbi:MAG: DUF4147 domain-containing protein [Thermoanaerobaculia bacterium]